MNSLRTHSEHSDKNLTAIAQAIESKSVDQLTEIQRRLLVNMSIADDIIRLYGPGKKATNIICHKTSLQKTEVYKLIGTAQAFYGTHVIYKKKYWKGLLCEKLYAEIVALEKEIFFIEEGKENDEEAIPMVNLKAAAVLIREYNGAIKQMTELLGLNEDELPFDPKEMYQVPILVTNVEELGITKTTRMSAYLEGKLKSLGAKIDENGRFK